MADLIAQDEFAKKLLADVEAFEAGIKSRLDALQALCQKSASNLEKGNEEVKNALAGVPAQG